jgi:hypothetical protein
VGTIFSVLLTRGLSSSLRLSARDCCDGLSFAPDALIANGRSRLLGPSCSESGAEIGASKAALEYASGSTEMHRFWVALTRAIVRAAGEQITPLYGTLCRSTPVFFLQDDHDHFDNDEATDEAVTFPPDNFMLQSARATQRLWYPEFLPDPNRSPGIPGSDSPDQSSFRPTGLSESFGTLRYGRLAEVLLYDVRRTVTLAGPTRCLSPRTRAWRAAPLHRYPSGEHFSYGLERDKSVMVSDLLGPDGKLSEMKPYWQRG